MPFYLSSNTLYFILSLSLSLAAWLSFPLCLFLCLSIIFSFFFLVFLFLTPCRVTSEARPAPRVSRGVGVSEKRSNPEKPEKHHLHAKTRVSEVTEWVPNIAGLIISVQIRRKKCSPISGHLFLAIKTELHHDVSDSHLLFNFLSFFKQTIAIKLLLKHFKLIL